MLCHLQMPEMLPVRTLFSGKDIRVLFGKLKIKYVICHL